MKLFILLCCFAVIACAEPHYGRLFLEHSLKKSPYSLGQNEQVDEVVFLNSQFRNAGHICLSISQLSADAFLSSGSAEDYFHSMAGVLGQIRQKGEKEWKNESEKNNILHSLNKYKHYFQFIETKHLPRRISDIANLLKSHEKTAILLGTGNHVSSISIQRQSDDLVFVLYFDPYQGTLFKQSLTQKELDEMQKQGFGSKHPKSILNQNNVLLGEAASRSDSGDLEVRISTLHFVIPPEVAAPEIDLFYENLKADEVLETLNLKPGILFEVIHSMAPVKDTPMDKFLERHQNDLRSSWHGYYQKSESLHSCKRNYLTELASDRANTFLRYTQSPLRVWNDKNTGIKKLKRTYPKGEYLIISASVKSPFSDETTDYISGNIDDYDALERYYRNTVSLEEICSVFSNKNQIQFGKKIKRYFAEFDQELLRKGIEAKGVPGASGMEQIAQYLPAFLSVAVIAGTVGYVFIKFRSIQAQKPRKR